MYDRAPRVLAATAPLARTSSEVGPGTYGVPDPSNIRTGKYSIPFNHSKLKEIELESLPNGFLESTL